MSIRLLLSTMARFESSQACALPRVLVLTDDARGFRLDHQMQAWPTGAAFIERTFGNPPYAKASRQDNIVRLASCTPRQARRAMLDGIHWPNARLKHRRTSATKGLIETVSAHRGLDIAKALGVGVRAVLISTIFASNSPSAKRSLGAVRLARLQRAFPSACLFALGGITQKSAACLRATGIYGIALVSFSASSQRLKLKPNG
jgi:thiamine-phosphate pyrophosphorylase